MTSWVPMRSPMSSLDNITGQAQIYNPRVPPMRRAVHSIAPVRTRPVEAAFDSMEPFLYRWHCHVGVIEGSQPVLTRRSTIGGNPSGPEGQSHIRVALKLGVYSAIGAALAPTGVGVPVVMVNEVLVEGRMTNRVALIDHLEFEGQIFGTINSVIRGHRTTERMLSRRSVRHCLRGSLARSKLKNHIGPCRLSSPLGPGPCLLPASTLLLTVAKLQLNAQNFSLAGTQLEIRRV